jgi:hypothetical protein
MIYSENLLDPQTQSIPLAKTEQPFFKSLAGLSKPSFRTEFMRLVEYARVHVVVYDIATDTGSSRQENSLTIMSATALNEVGDYNYRRTSPSVRPQAQLVAAVQWPHGRSA